MAPIDHNVLKPEFLLSHAHDIMFVILMFSTIHYNIMGQIDVKNELLYRGCVHDPIALTRLILVDLDDNIFYL